MMIGLGAALLALGGLGGGYLASQGGQAVSVLTVRSDMTAGHRITATDLGSTQITGGEGLHMVPASDSNQVVGRYVTSDLPSGSLLTPDLTTAKIAPPTGRSILGIALKPSQMPATGLHQGDPLRLVVGTSPGGQPGGDADLTPGTSWQATVVSVGPSVNEDGTRTVDVSVTADTATKLAAASTSGTMVAVLDPQGR